MKTTIILKIRKKDKLKENLKSNFVNVNKKQVIIKILNEIINNFIKNYLNSKWFLFYIKTEKKFVQI